MVEGVGGEAGFFERLGEGLLAQGDVGVLAEALLPHPGRGFARGAPAVEELGRGRGRTDVLGQQRAGEVVATEEGGGPVAPVPFVGAARQSRAQVGEHDQGGPGAVQGAPQGADPGAHRPGHVEGGRRAAEAEGGVDGGGVGLVLIGGTGRGEEQGVGGELRSGAARLPTGLHGQGRGVFVVGGDGPPALARRATERLPDLPPVQPVEGDVGPIRKDSLHGRQHARLTPLWPSRWTGQDQPQVSRRHPRANLGM